MEMIFWFIVGWLLSVIIYNYRKSEEKMLKMIIERLIKQFFDTNEKDLKEFINKIEFDYKTEINTKINIIIINYDFIESDIIKIYLEYLFLKYEEDKMWKFNSFLNRDKNFYNYWKIINKYKHLVNDWILTEDEGLRKLYANLWFEKIYEGKVWFEERILFNFN